MSSSSSDPIVRFRDLYDRAVATGMKNPNAMVLASVGEGGRPSARAVLLKVFDERGFVFFTNFESRKGAQILANAHVALHAYWRELDHQVSIEGDATAVTDEEADAYFVSRPRGSRIGAWASLQSQPLESRTRLLARVAKVEARYLGRDVPRPPHWSGFRVVPSRIEFWKEGAFRLHDRFLFKRAGNTWTRQRLYP